MGLSYCYYSDVDGVIYSLDMIRLKYHIHSYLNHRFLTVLNKMFFVWHVFSECFGPSFKEGSYKYLYSCRKDDYSFSVGFGLQTSFSSSGCDCFIEFNPNKVDMQLMHIILNWISQYVVPVEGKIFHVVRYDLAVDLPYPRSQVILRKKGKRVYTKIIAKSVTEYLGKRNTNGFTKVYDKRVEAELDYPLTRVEITCDKLFEIAFPDIFVIGDSVDLEVLGLNSTDQVLITLLREQVPERQQELFRALGRGKQRKLQGLIFPVEQQFKFDVLAVASLMSVIEKLEAASSYISFYQMPAEEDVLPDKNGMKIFMEDIDNEIYQQFTLFDQQYNSFNE